LNNVLGPGLDHFVRTSGAQTTGPAVERREKGIGARPARAAIFTFEILLDLFVIFLDMPVGIDDLGMRHAVLPICSG
jgi:hypothetical protein